MNFTPGGMQTTAFVVVAILVVCGIALILLRTQRVGSLDCPSRGAACRAARVGGQLAARAMSTELLAVLFLAIVIPIFLVQWSRRSEARAFESERYLGGVTDVGVSIAFDGRRRWVELLFAERTRGGPMTVHVFLTPSEALLVSEWIRTAATPGRTLADARRRRKRAHA